jgi:aconitate hydratase
MSPPLVVAFALAGRIDIDLDVDPLGKDSAGNPVFLREIWPTLDEVRELLATTVKPEVFRRLYQGFADQNPLWNQINSTAGEVYGWDSSSTYIQEPPFFQNFELTPKPVSVITGARALGIFGDSVTTDHISPAGSIKKSSPAGQYLLEHNVSLPDFNSYGSRRGNDRVMTRGTFANVRIKNLMVPGTEGGVTTHQPSGEVLSIFDAATKYAGEGTPLLIFAGLEYGTGSSRDWAAKGTALLGVRAVIAQSYERIHRSNLIGMGILPLQLKEGVSALSLRLDGSEIFDLEELPADLQPRQDLKLTIRRANGQQDQVTLCCRIDTPIEVEYYRHGGILPYVLRQLLDR